MRERQFKKFFIVYGHYDDNSFNAAIRDTFIEEAKKCGHEIDLINLFDEKIYLNWSYNHEILQSRNSSTRSNEKTL